MPSDPRLLPSLARGHTEIFLKAFAEMVRGEKENPYTYDYELTLFRAISECCKENATTK